MHPTAVPFLHAVTRVILYEALFITHAPLARSFIMPATGRMLWGVHSKPMSLHASAIPSGPCKKADCRHSIERGVVPDWNAQRLVLANM